MGLFKAVATLSVLPSFVHGLHLKLDSDLTGFVGGQGILNTAHLPFELKKRLRNELSSPHHQTEGVPGLKVGVVDSGASAICRGSKDSFLPGTHGADLTETKQGGIAGGLDIQG